MPCRGSGLPHDTRYIVGTSGNVFWTTTAREGLPSALFEHSKNLTSSSHELRPEIIGNTMVPKRKMRREPQNSSIPAPRFQSGGGILNHSGGTYSHGGMIDYTSFPISEMHPGRFPDSTEFQSWKVNFKTEVCSKSADPHLTMHWSKEVETAKSIDELMTARSIMDRTDFPDYNICFVLETTRTGAMRVVHITVNIEKTQILRIKFVRVLSYLNSNTTSVNSLHCTVLPVLTNTSKSTFPTVNQVKDPGNKFLLTGQWSWQQTNLPFCTANKSTHQTAGRHFHLWIPGMRACLAVGNSSKDEEVSRRHIFVLIKLDLCFDRRLRQQTNVYVSHIFRLFTTKGVARISTICLLRWLRLHW